MNAQQMAQEVVERLTPQAAGTYQNTPFWHAPALRGAFIAGAEWQEKQAAEKLAAESNGKQELIPADA